MGRRHRETSFMPGIYVFPGGRVDPADSRTTGFAEKIAPAPAGADLATRRRLAVFVRTALRETFEETGLLLAAPGPPPKTGAAVRQSARATVWQAYAHTGLRPAFNALALVARAVTPTVSPIRFHTRFFRADGRAARGRLAGDGELEDIGWIPVGEIDRLPTAQVTSLVLREALDQTARAAERPAPLFLWSGADRGPRRIVPGRRA